MAIKEVINKDGSKSYDVYVDGIDARGHRIQMRKRARTKRKAEDLEFEIKRQIVNMRESRPNYTWSEWFSVCVERMRVELKASTMLGYTGKNKIWIEPAWKEKLLKDITATDVHEVIFNSKFDVAWYTRRSTLKIVHRILQLAVEEGLIPFNPSAKVKVKVPEVRQAVLNKNEVDKLLREAKLCNHRFYEIWVLAVLTGMRSGELYALKWADVDFDQGLIWIQRSWSSKNGYGPTKTSRNRVMPISTELRKFLTELKLKSAEREGFVLPHLPEWSQGSQAEVLRDFCDGIGITSVKFHDLRATFITQMLSRGVALANVMALVGHSAIKTTQGYLRLAGLEIKGTTEQLGITLPNFDEAKILSFKAH